MGEILLLAASASVVFGMLYVASGELARLTKAIRNTKYYAELTADAVHAEISEIRRILERLAKVVQASRVLFYDRRTRMKIEMANMKITQKLPLSIEVVDAQGNPAVLDGAPAWSLTDPSKGSLAVASDGMSAEFTPAGSIGDLAIEVAGDADLGPGVRTLLGTLPVHIVAGDAVAINIAAGAPIDI